MLKSKFLYKKSLRTFKEVVCC